VIKKWWSSNLKLRPRNTVLSNYIALRYYRYYCKRIDKIYSTLQSTNQVRLIFAFFIIIGRFPLRWMICGPLMCRWDPYYLLLLDLYVMQLHFLWNLMMMLTSVFIHYIMVCFKNYSRN
jgi:hypothetical protein